MDQLSDVLMLYETSWCPFCKRVVKAIQRLNAPVERRDIDQNPVWAAELQAARGRRTVPVLRGQDANGDDWWLPESADIVKYLEQRFGGAQPS